MLKRPINVYAVLILSGLFLGGCDDLLEDDISKAVVTHLAPCDSCSINASEIVFWWAQVEDADRYQLQVVSPGFDQIKQLIVDTIVTDDKWSAEFKHGNYQWRIKALNSYYQTEFFTWDFKVDTTGLNSGKKEVDGESDVTESN